MDAMQLNPVSVLVTLLAGLALAGILGWIRRPRLVVFVPRLFAHSRISDHGQIVEISVMNRGFKTEEHIELTLNPQFRYDLIGSNNPDAVVDRSRLTIPRIGSADDCSVLLQVEGGRFNHSDIVSCLSKETNGVVKTKLEEIPVTAQQRVGLLAFAAVCAALGLGILGALDMLKSDTTSSVSGSPSPPQGWKISEIYQGDYLYEEFTARRILLELGAPVVKDGIASIPLRAANNTQVAIELTAYVTAAASQDRLDASQGRVANRLMFPAGEGVHTLKAVVGRSQNERQILVSFFIEGEDGETLAGKRLIRID